ncbi:MAG: MATE family efflux transporter [Clostridiales bacterium]|nr:MATE family efflux transporter [Clostridiales bacterium]
MIQLSDHFTYKKLLRFTLPSIVMMIFTSVYGVVDGFFVSNFAGKTPFAAVNFIMPFLMILGSAGFMIGAGGSALISKTLGEGDNEKAKRVFSLLVYVTLIGGVIIAVLGIIFIRPIGALLGAQGSMLDDCVVYGRIILIALPFFMLQNEFQTFFVTAEKPQLGLIVTVIAGVTNMVLDALLVAVLKWGLVGAAVATAASQLVGGVVPLVYFFRKNSSLLKLGKTSFDGRALGKTCFNGMSELLSNISMSIVSMLYNMQLLKYIGEDGVAAYGVLMYVNFIFFAIFIGYSVGSAPIVGFNYGAKNYDELKNLRKKSFIIMGVLSVVLFGVAELLATPLAKLFVGYDAALTELTVRAFFICSFMFIFGGISVYGSSFFTALNNGVVSAIIAFMRTMVFQVAAVMLLPLIMGIDGIWLSIVVAEAMSMLITIIFVIALRKKYNY